MIGGLFFYFFAALTVLCALMTITRKEAVTSAFWLIFCFLNVAAVFALLSAHLIAILQILIYTGAIMVFFLFVIMFLGEGKGMLEGTSRPGMTIGLLTLLASIAVMIRIVSKSPTEGFPALSDGYGSIESVSELLLTDYILTFELTGLLLTVAVIGAVFMARRQGKGNKRASTPEGGTANV